MILTAPRLYCVGTHHKTGTLWMRAVFRRLAAALGVASHVVYPATGVCKVTRDGERSILLSWSSRFPDWLRARPDARILHLIRDPRDVLLSGAAYHAHAGPKGEQFLHEPREDLDGKTYQQHLNALPTQRDKLLFEMRGKHARTVAEMTAWQPAPNTVEARYEVLMSDETGTAFREHLRDLGLPEPEVETGVEIFWAKSLWGGLADEAARHNRIAAHVSSGKVARWRTELPRDVAEPYADEFGPALVALGYEDHPTRWLSELRHAA
ncbi:sulfotransferase domain-containing protein [Jannaschia aquimarina]|uniref:Sulfotransferase domain protein n=1 Tax=Jannaschia aquimarina TaxID=935700 RepID=A0A0D1CS68_9RHOB|nr:sulfotransferase domain-containing protein [Jannaschia aquimarina]KIT17637.1 Sulfotransferase domain protein [Jannaschia aquimarina]SNS80271.1 Sulfotransferase domain-containing protein [Jannaschia aquimarina]